jgi:hypothetical protein
LRGPGVMGDMDAIKVHGAAIAAAIF